MITDWTVALLLVPRAVLRRLENYFIPLLGIHGPLLYAVGVHKLEHTEIITNRFDSVLARGGTNRNQILAPFMSFIEYRKNLSAAKLFLYELVHQVQ